MTSSQALFSMRACSPKARARQLAKPVVVFDGVCNLCNGSVDFIVKRDADGLFQFASSQSAAGEELLKESGLHDFDGETVALIEDGVGTVRSTAVLQIARRLGYPWKLAYGFIVVPRVVRDGAYRLMAHNRYRLFGTRDACRLPTPEERGRFLG